MPRSARVAPGGVAFHVLNRGVGGMRLFDNDADYLAFERVLEETLGLRPMRLCAYCVMPNHWHLVLWPREDGDLANFMQRLTITHARRWQEHRRLVGTGHIYQGRYKSFPVQSDGHFLTVCRYVEQNALRANLVDRAEDWRWSSLWRRRQRATDARAILNEWPIPRPGDWLAEVNHRAAESELTKLRYCAVRGRPFGNEAWVLQTAKRLGLNSTLRPRGRPRKAHTPSRDQ